MPDLVTLAEAKAWCRVEHDDEDALFGTLIAAASEAVRDVATEWDDSAPVPARIKLAILTRIAIAFDSRESMEPGKGESAFLAPLRVLEV